ncbi:hypothetical protein BM527_15140 [Alteromonas sp. Mex14]|jgi:hypothetical protein|nr:hypothetical protein BM527_15140 [Alteromonas sp. Mex14]
MALNYYCKRVVRGDGIAKQLKTVELKKLTIVNFNSPNGMNDTMMFETDEIRQLAQAGGR